MLLLSYTRISPASRIRPAAGGGVPPPLRWIMKAVDSYRRGRVPRPDGKGRSSRRFFRAGKPRPYGGCRRQLRTGRAQWRNDTFRPFRLALSAATRRPSQAADRRQLSQRESQGRCRAGGFYDTTQPAWISMVFPNLVNLPGSQQVMNTCPEEIWFSTKSCRP